MSDDDLLTTTAAARAAGVGVSSLKRWADLELIPCVRTAGGHRRFRQADVQQFLSGPLPASPEQAFQREPEQGHNNTTASTASGKWIDLLVGANAYELQGELLTARGRLGSWYAVAEQLGAALTELGKRWACGETSILDEHIASETLSRAVQRVIESLPSGDERHRALLATAEKDDHTLGLLLAELCLREVGWTTVWAGRETPSSELIAVLESRTIQLVALSASECSRDAEALAGQAERIGAACRAAGVNLILGGGGRWPAQPSYGSRLIDFAALHRIARLWLDS